MTCQLLEVDQQILCILSYDGSKKDVMLNFSILIINIVMASIQLLHARAYECHDLHWIRASRRRMLRALLSLTFMTAFQIILCLFVGCTGISIIWCGIFGWILMDLLKKRRERQCVEVTNQQSSNARVNNIAMHQTIVFMINVFVISYYAVVAEPITTIAHV